MPPFLADKDNNLLPGLFTTDFEVNEDLTVYTFHIDPRAVWSDGKPVTAQDVVDWWNLIFHPLHSVQDWMRGTIMSAVQGIDEFAAGDAETIEGLQVIDDKTLQVTLWRPEGSLPLFWSFNQAAGIARADQLAFLAERADEFATPQDWLAAATEPFFQGENAADLIVSGPFKPVHLSPEPDAQYIFEQNPLWWGDQKPLLTRVETTTIRDFQTMLLMFQNQEIDYTELSGPPAVSLRREQPDVFREVPIAAFWAMYVDTTKEPTDDVNLRRALMAAIDWEQVATIAWEGEQAPSNAGSPMGPAFKCYDPNFQPYPFDPEQAKTYLAQSQYGADLANMPKIRILTAGSDPSRIRAAQIVQEFWRVNLGLENVEIKNQESEFVEGPGLVNIYVSSGGSFLPLPAYLVQGLGHTGAGVYSTWTHYSEPGWDEEIDALLAMDPDDSAYCERSLEMLQKITDAAVVIPTGYIKSWYQVQPWLKGFEQSRTSAWYTLFDTYVTER